MPVYNWVWAFVPAFDFWIRGYIMIKTKVFTGNLPDVPWFDVYLCAMRGPNALKFTIQAKDSDAAVEAVLELENAPFSAFVAVYQCDPTPTLSSAYGAPMGRASDNLQFNETTKPRARKIRLDSGGYDKGGAYWGLRFGKESLYCVEDGDGNLGFFDAINGKHAIEKAMT